MWLKLLKMSIRNSANDWLALDDFQRTRGGNICQPSAATLRGWLQTVWNEVSSEAIKKCFAVRFLGPVEELHIAKNSHMKPMFLDKMIEAIQYDLELMDVKDSEGVFSVIEDE